jgi:hypothetical protein
MIVATEAYNRLKPPVSHWANIAQINVIENGKDLGGHAVLFYQPETGGNVFMYDEDGTVDMFTQSHELSTLIESANKRFSLLNSPDRFRAIRWVVGSEATSSKSIDIAQSNKNYEDWQKTQQQKLDLVPVATPTPPTAAPKAAPTAQHKKTTKFMTTTELITTAAIIAFIGLSTWGLWVIGKYDRRRRARSVSSGDKPYKFGDLYATYLLVFSVVSLVNLPRLDMDGRATLIFVALFVALPGAYGFSLWLRLKPALWFSWVHFAVITWLLVSNITAATATNDAAMQNQLGEKIGREIIGWVFALLIIIYLQKRYKELWPRRKQQVTVQPPPPPAAPTATPVAPEPVFAAPVSASRYRGEVIDIA